MKAPRNLTVTKDRVPEVLAALATIENQRVLLGVPGSEAERQEEGGKRPEINNAALAYIHENGSPEANIPARPFLGPGIRSVRAYVTAQYAKAAEDALAGNSATIEKRLHAMGLKAQAAIRQRIVDGPFVPLAESTLAKRAARGVTRDKPLIDTGQLRNSITYVIRKRGSK